MPLDRPETWLAIHGLLLAFLWEMLQMPFYEMGASTVLGEIGLVPALMWITVPLLALALAGRSTCSACTAR